MYEANHDDDPKHPVPRGLLGVLRCYGTLCEEVGSHFRGQGDTASRLRSLQSRRDATLRECSASAPRAFRS